MTLWLILASLVVVVVTYVALAGARLRGAMERPVEEIFAARREELAEDLGGGTIDPATRETLEAELARNAVREVRPATQLVAATVRDRSLALLALLLLVAGVSVPVYLQLGSPQLASGEVPQGTGNHPSVAQMEEELTKRVEASPKDPDARMWLARIYVSTQRYGQAVDQYEAVLKLIGDNAAVLVQYADALAMLNGGRLSGKPAALIERALAAEPANPTALWLGGLAADEAGDRPKALGLLQKARAAAMAAEMPVEELDAQIAALGGEPAKDAAATPSARITVAVTLDPALASKVGPNATLFVLAKRPEGMPMPLAVKRLPAQGFPLQVVLDDSLAMAPIAKLSSAEVVDVTARISQAGQPIAASGDLEGVQRGVAVGPDVHLEISINQLVP